jgi:hypothetical protein
MARYEMLTDGMLENIASHLEYPVGLRGREYYEHVNALHGSARQLLLYYKQLKHLYNDACERAHAAERKLLKMEVECGKCERANHHKRLEVPPCDPQP